MTNTNVFELTLRDGKKFTFFFTAGVSSNLMRQLLDENGIAYKCTPHDVYIARRENRKRRHKKDLKIKL